MSFYRTLLATFAALVIAAPVFAADETPAEQPADANSITIADTASTTTTTETTETKTTAPAGEVATTEQAKVNLNKATAKDLVKVKGLNAARARAIVAYRKKHGDFKATTELSNVKGFKKLKQEKLQEIEAQVSVE